MSRRPARGLTSIFALGRIVVLGFLAGFLGAIVFHEAAIALLYVTGQTPFPPFPTRATGPLGLPQFISLAFWGGVWGVLLAVIVTRSGTAARHYWLAAFLVGALVPTLFAWFVVAPLKGRPAASGFQPWLMIRALLVNGAWGLGTAWFLRWAQRLISR